MIASDKFLSYKQIEAIPLEPASGVRCVGLTTKARKIYNQCQKYNQ